MKYTKPKFYIRIFVMLSCTLLGSLILTAQDASTSVAPVDAQSSSSASEADDTLLGAIKKGGLAKYPLLAFSVATFGLVLYNSMTIRSGHIINQPVITSEVLPALEAKDYSKAMEICETHKKFA